MKTDISKAPELMTQDELEEAIDCQLEFIKNVGCRYLVPYNIREMPLVDQLRELDKLAAQAVELSREEDCDC